MFSLSLVSHEDVRPWLRTKPSHLFLAPRHTDCIPNLQGKCQENLMSSHLQSMNCGPIKPERISQPSLICSNHSTILQREPNGVCNFCGYIKEIGFIFPCLMTGVFLLQLLPVSQFPICLIPCPLFCES